MAHWTEPYPQPTDEVGTTLSNSGVLSADGETVILYAPNMSGAVVTIDGTFEGRVTLTGAAEDGGTEGGRLLFQSGVGSVGRNYVTGFGVPVSREYRILAGGDYIIARASDWVSGSVTVNIKAQNAQNVTFINGPVHGSFEEATRAQRAYTGGLTPVTVGSTNVAHVIISNPSDSDKFLMLLNRLFSNDNQDTDDHIVYQVYINPTVDTSAWDTPAPANLYLGGTPSAMEIFTTVGAAETMGGTEASGEILPNNGPYARKLLAIIPPGNSVGFTMEGSGGGSNANEVSLVFEYYEEDLQ